MVGSAGNMDIQTHYYWSDWTLHRRMNSRIPVIIMYQIGVEPSDAVFQGWQLLCLDSTEIEGVLVTRAFFNENGVLFPLDWGQVLAVYRTLSLPFA